MTQPLLSVEELSRLVDGETTPEEKAALNARLAQCPVSRQLYDSMRELSATLSAALVENTSVDIFPAAEDCLNAETLLLLSENKLPAKELAAAEQHAAGCSRCLRALLTEMRSQTSMVRANWKAIPQHIAKNPKLGGLAARPAKSGPVKTPSTATADSKESVDHIPAVQPPGQEIQRQEYLHRLSNAKTVHKTFRNGVWALEVDIQPVNALTANLQLQLTKAGAPVRETEITVLEGTAGRKIFRGLSSRDGMVLVRKLRAGSYDLHAPAGSLYVRLSLE